jgi:gliding motility-associated-like protein
MAMVIPVYSQKDCTVPEGSVLRKVSVNPSTGFTELSWSLSPATGINAYIIYSHTSGYWITIDTLWDPAATSYSYFSPGTRYFSESYVVAAFRKPICTSPLSNILSTIYCTSEIDTCHKQIILKWNRYTASPLKVLDYRIMVSKDDSPLAETFTTDSLSSTYVIDDFETDSKYCFVVKANLEGGNESFSNQVCSETHMQRPPAWINADYATVNQQGKIDLSFTYDPLSEITSFRLEKKTGSSGSFQSAAQLSSNTGNIVFTDNAADISTINYYRLAALNNCQIPITLSNQASNILLSIDRVNEVINLRWNHYSKWNGTSGAGRLLVNSGNGWSERFPIPPADTVFSIRYSDLMYELKGSELCFSLEAVETGNPHGVAGVSRSNDVCTPSTEKITVPNTFTPDHNLVNDTFRPVLSFTPSNYRMVITDMKRKVVFETNDYTAEWDGTDNGTALPEGVYLWFLKATSSSGKTYTRSGTVSIVFNR